MVAIRLVGYGNDDSKGPHRISKDVEWPVVPRVGEVIHIVPKAGQMRVGEVTHLFVEGVIEVQFNDRRDQLQIYAEKDGFQIG